MNMLYTIGCMSTPLPRVQNSVTTENDMMRSVTVIWVYCHNDKKSLRHLMPRYASDRNYDIWIRLLHRKMYLTSVAWCSVNLRCDNIFGSSGKAVAESFTPVTLDTIIIQRKLIRHLVKYWLRLCVLYNVKEH